MTAVKSHYILYYVERAGYECRDCSTVQLGYFKKDETVYLAIIKRLHVGIIKKKMSSLLSHKVEVEPGDFAAISEEKYHAIKKCRIENKISGASQNQPEFQQSAKEPEPSLFGKKNTRAGSFVKYLLHEVEGEVKLNVQKDADCNVRVSIL